MEYKIGDMVPKTGKYQCSACGNVQVFEKGEEFTDCDACLGGDEVSWVLVEETPTMD